MKKLITLAVISFAFMSTAHAGFYLPNGWKSQAYVNVTPFQVTATVYNNTRRPIVCSGQVFGQTRNGMTLNAWLRNQVVYPGMHARAYVYSNNRFNHFVNGWANIWCRHI